MSVLVTGGAGYIGSHAVLELLKKGEDVIIVDNLSKGHKDAVLGGKFYKGDLRDSEFLNKVFSENDIEAVIHFAAYSLVGESVSMPLEYYENNFICALNLLKVMNSHNVNKIIFSSTAATYGEPENIPILETDKTEPTNPYGETKLSVEKMLKWSDTAYGIKYASLRYFNACGADESGNIGEDHDPESHLIPIVLKTALGQRESITVFGEDYDTKDGTCIRDYIHVTDLADAHILALYSLREDEKSAIYNLGSGKGFSVKEIIDKAREVTGKKIPAIIGDRRPGDPAALVASSRRIKEKLNWNPKFDDIGKIIESAWKWHSSHPHGYNK
ncbi:UDP-glucose 4-epimerase [Oxobacter pfennigii]|uniref:UDP-glucose 4-epimerase n=1 Tax=Oxobacter pfennigii TaxID=36849 RepID=A0A0P8YXN1_9CLOT|nr:UDP-glucose 4-epimerase GalE [Oxobacter pfennigii]KPU44526.1 UDP-glucose 4-epimerase [Oxobacter pfennigii]